MIRIDQIAIAAKNPEQLIEKYKTFGYNNWIHDRVVANGFCYGQPTTPTADLYFNYDSGIEIEILKYVNDGNSNWHQPIIQNTNSDFETFPSHVGVHVNNAQDMDDYFSLVTKAFPKSTVVQEVLTSSHTNPEIKGKRLYHYIILDTRNYLGFDLKFIRRIMLKP